MHRQLVEAMPGDAYIAYDVEPLNLQSVLVVPRTAVAVLTRHPWKGHRWAAAYAADPADPAHVAAAVELAVELIDRSSSGVPAKGITVPRGGIPLMPEHLRPVSYNDWDCWSTTVAPAASSSAYGDAARVVDVAADDPRLAQLLAIASPDAPYPAGDPRVVRWAVVEDPEGGLPGTGGLAAMLAVTRQASGAAHLNDVATHPERRGKALARLLCGTVTTQALADGAPAVTLDMYASNDVARRLYTGLGFVWGRGNSSGLLPAQHRG